MAPHGSHRFSFALGLFIHANHRSPPKPGAIQLIDNPTESSIIRSVMRFINPKTDFAFKKIFGSSGSQGILRSFLNAVLYEGLPRIASLQIVDPYSIPRLEGMKDSYLDVRAVLDDGQHVIIEMQVLNVPGMEKRVLYNAAKEYSNQLVKGQDYRLLNPVIALTLTDFIMFPELEGQVISRFILAEKNKLIAYPEGDVELVFVELPKFRRELSELRGLTDEWLYFVHRAGELDQVPERLGKVDEIEDAFEIAQAARLTADEEHALELKTRWIADQRMILAAKKDAEAHAAAAIAAKKDAEAHAVAAIAAKQNAEAQAQNAEAKAQNAEAKAQNAEAKAQRYLTSFVQLLNQQGASEAAIAKQLGISVEEVRALL
jgi:predicted transposase/invertase (TIGR01784 family)